MGIYIMSLNRFFVGFPMIRMWLYGGVFLCAANIAVANSLNSNDLVAPSLAAIQLRNDVLEKEIENLTVYHRHLNSLSLSGEKLHSTSSTKLGDINVEQQAMLYQMILDLENFVALDLPIERVERQKKIAALKNMMTQSIYSEVEKYQRILTVWRSEMQIGHRFFSYPTFLTDQNGDKVAVTALHFGRMSLIAQQVDGSRFWQWDGKQKNWRLASVEQHKDYQYAFDVLKQKRIKNWVTLPMTMANVEEIQ
jgi:hypothetical protein